MKHIVILGGGTSGWLTASYLAARLNAGERPAVQITVIEAADIPTIGVGEATTPSLRTTLGDIGIHEHDFMRAASATFKHGILFANWSAAPETNAHDAYFHPFERPLRVGPDSLAPYWLRGIDPHNRRFEDAVSIQSALARRGFAPKRFQDPAYGGPMPYAYHLDAGRFAVLLKASALKRGVRHLPAKVLGADQTPDGAISALLLEDGQRQTADFFIDCSGFHGLLIEKALGEPFADRSHILFCDAAVTCQVPYGPGESARPYTTATAMPAGWVWDIGLIDRRGIGYVYSTRYCDAHKAEQTLRRYIGPAADGLNTRQLKFYVGYRRRQWIGNCVAVGLSGGFIEPLESTGIHLVEQAAWALAAMLPRYFQGQQPQMRFNAIMANHYDMIVDFVKYHYSITGRRDSDFWCDNADPKSWTAYLIEKDAQWHAAIPDIYDMNHLHSIFDHASYQYVGFGMGRRPSRHALPDGGRTALARQVFDRVAQGLKKAESMLPSHRDLTGTIHQANANGSFGLDVNAHAMVNASLLNIPNNYATR